MTDIPSNSLIEAEIAILRKIEEEIFGDLSAEDLCRDAQVSRCGLSSHGCFIDFSYPGAQPNGRERSVLGFLYDCDHLDPDGNLCSFGFVAHLVAERILSMELFSYGCEFPTSLRNIEVEIG